VYNVASDIAYPRFQNRARPTPNSTEFMTLKSFSFSRPDRTNGRAYAAVSRPSVAVCDVMYCGQTVRPRAKVTIESL